jgi:hypothetical protein
MLIMRKPLALLFIVIFVGLPITFVAAQQVHWIKSEDGWVSPTFVPSKNTRIEWDAYPLADFTNPTFNILITEENVGVIDSKGGLSGIGSLDNWFGRTVRIEIDAAGIRLWEIRLFNLETPPLPETTTATTTPPVTTTTTPPVTTTEPTATITTTVGEVTTTQQITIAEETFVTTTLYATTVITTVAVYTAMPSNARLTYVGWGFIFLGFLAAGLIGLAILFFRKYVMIEFYSKVQLEEYDKDEQDDQTTPVAESEKETPDD